jgi:ABC-2 type transport system ATP-binding protein
MAASINIEKLTKYYPGSKVAALDALTLQVQPGEVYGFLGANGAGKSTTIRLLMNFLQPTSGSAKIMELDSVEQSVEARKYVGYLSGDVALYSKPTGRQLLDYLSSLQGKADKEYRASLEKRFQAELDKPLSDLSKGNRQKIGILQALMHRPNVLILDEPTSGLDPLMQEVFYDTLKEAKQHGTAVFMSSHNLAEAERVCDRVGIIKHGKLIREQTIGESTELGGTVFRVSFASPSAIAELKKTVGLKFLSQEGGNTALVQPSGSLSAALKALGQFDVRELTTQKLTLEDEFIEFYQESQ